MAKNCAVFHTSPKFDVLISAIIIPHQKLLQSDWSFTHQHFSCLFLSAFESCHMIDITLPRKPNIYHPSFRKVILRRVLF